MRVKASIAILTAGVLLGGCALAGKLDSAPPSSGGSVTPQILQTQQPPTTLIQLPVPIAAGSPGVVSVISVSKVNFNSTWFAATGATQSGIGLASNDGSIQFIPVESGPARRVLEGIGGGPSEFWVTARGPAGSSVLKVTAGGTITDYPVRNEPGAIAGNGDSRFWFADNEKNPDGSYDGFIAAIDSSGNVTYYRVPGNYRIRNVATDPFGFTVFSAENRAPGGGGGFVGLMDLHGSIVKQYAVANGWYPDSIAFAANNLWFAIHPSPHAAGSDALVFVDKTSGVVTEYPTTVIPQTLVGNTVQSPVIFTACAKPHCTPGSWVIDQMATNGHVGTIFTANSVNGLNGIAIGADGNLWVGDSAPFVDVFVRELVTVQPSSLALTVGQSDYVTSFSSRGRVLAGSSKPAVATVTLHPNQLNQFTVTAVSKGTCVLTFHTERFNSAKVSVTVN